MIETVSDSLRGAHGCLEENVQGIVLGLATQVEQLRGAKWSSMADRELASALANLETLSRRLEAITATATAERLARIEASGKSTGSAATQIASTLGLPPGTVRSRAEAGGRAGTPAMRAHQEGRITAAQERAIAECVAELPSDAPKQAHSDFGSYLVEHAEQGASSRALRTTGARELAILDPTRLDRLDALQQQRREVRLGAVGTEGLSAVGITCEPRLRALVDAVLARFAAPGMCIGVSAPTGKAHSLPVDSAAPAGTPASWEELSESDTRTFGQRAYDALCHVLALGLEAEPSTAKGVATIVVRVSPEQMDAIQAAQMAEKAQVNSDCAGYIAATSCAAFQEFGSQGGLVTTSVGTEMSTRQALSLAGNRNWFLSAFRDGHEELHRIDIDRSGTRRLATTLQRLVLYSAHGGCTHPGCEQSAAICQAHHVIDFARGGPTTIENLALACPTHHGWIGNDSAHWRTVPNSNSPGRPRWIPPATEYTAA